MPDSFATRARRPADPAVTIFEITPDDTSDLPHVTTALNVATPGTVRVTMQDGTQSDVQIHPGHMFALRVRRVWRSGTTATGIRGLA